jgi:HK97 family phage major capsid protein
MAPVYTLEPKTRDHLRRYSMLTREHRDSVRSSLAEFRALEGKGITVAAPSGDSAWWRYALAKFNKSELDLPEQRALARASGAAGNFLVPTDLEEQIIGAARAESAISRLARPITTDSGSTLSLPTAPTHGSAAWVAEGAATSPSDEVFGEVPLGAPKASTKVIASEELAQDPRADFDEYLADELGRRLGVIEGASFANGSGSGQPQGLAGNVPNVTAATGSATAYKLVDLTSIYRALPVQYRDSASWLIHPDDFAGLASLVDSSGGLVLPSLQSAAPTLFARPVELEPYLAAPAAGAKSLVFGNVKLAYSIRRVAGISVQRLEELHSDNGQLGYRARERVDGRVALGDACRALAHSAT